MKRPILLTAFVIGVTASASISDASPPPPQAACTGASALAADQWPVGGEARRDAFTTSDCARFVLKRAAVAAPDGFMPDELYVVADGKREGSATGYNYGEFVGRTPTVSYRYRFQVKKEKNETAVEGSVERPPISHLGLPLPPNVRQGDGIDRRINCTSRSHDCSLMVQIVSGDVVTSLFSARFNAQAPAGDLCLSSPGPGAGSAGPAIQISTDGARLASAQAPAGESQICLGPKSAKVIESMIGARRLEFRVLRAPGDRAMPWDRTEIDAEGLAETIGLTKYLLAHAILSDDRVKAEDAFASQAGRVAR